MLLLRSGTAWPAQPESCRCRVLLQVRDHHHVASGHRPDPEPAVAPVGDRRRPILIPEPGTTAIFARKRATVPPSTTAARSTRRLGSASPARALDVPCLSGRQRTARAGRQRVGLPVAMTAFGTASAIGLALVVATVAQGSKSPTKTSYAVPGPRLPRRTWVAYTCRAQTSTAMSTTTTADIHVALERYSGLVRPGPPATNQNMPPPWHVAR